MDRCAYITRPVSLTLPFTQCWHRKMDEWPPDPEWWLAYGNKNEWEDHPRKNKGLQYEITQYRAGPCNSVVEHSPSMLEITGSILNTAEQKTHTKSDKQVARAQRKHVTPHLPTSPQVVTHCSQLLQKLGWVPLWHPRLVFNSRALCDPPASTSWVSGTITRWFHA